MPSPRSKVSNARLNSSYASPAGDLALDAYAMRVPSEAVGGAVDDA